MLRLLHVHLWDAVVYTEQRWCDGNDSQVAIDMARKGRRKSDVSDELTDESAGKPAWFVFHHRISWIYYHNWIEVTIKILCIHNVLCFALYCTVCNVYCFQILSIICVQSSTLLIWLGLNVPIALVMWANASKVICILATYNCHFLMHFISCLCNKSFWVKCCAEFT